MGRDRRLDKEGLKQNMITLGVSNEATGASGPPAENTVKEKYKKTKIGWIPEDWDLLRLGDIATIQSGIQKGAKNNGLLTTLPYLRVANVQDGHIDLNEIKYIDVPVEKVERYLLKEGDVLMNEGGDFDKLGRGVVWEGQIKPCVHQNHVFAVRIDQRFITPGFLNLLTKTYYGRKYFILSSKQSTNLASINSSQLKNFPVLMPPYKELVAIEEYLLKWDKAIDILTQLIAEKQQKKKALMQQLLTGKKRFPEFDREWKTYRYAQLLKVVKRPVAWNDEDLYHLVSVRRRSGGLFERESLYGHQIKTKDLRTAKTGDFLISKMQIVHGASGLVTEQFDGMKISGSYIAVRAKDEKLLNINFLNWWSKMPYFYHQTYISSYGVHIEKMTFDFKSFLKLKMKVASLTEQEKIVGILNSLESELTTLGLKLDEFKDQKKGLMQQLLTGRTRLKYE